MHGGLQVLVLHKYGRGFYALFNDEHRHIRVRFVSPTGWNRELSGKFVVQRNELYERAKEKKPEPWSCRTRNW